MMVGSKENTSLAKRGLFSSYLEGCKVQEESVVLFHCLRNHVEQ